MILKDGYLWQGYECTAEQREILDQLFFRLDYYFVHIPFIRSSLWSCRESSIGWTDGYQGARRRHQTSG